MGCCYDSATNYRHKTDNCKNIEAERTMVGAFCLHEVMHPENGANMPLFQRYADLDYNYNDAR
jgi:hypothetical protein